MKPLAALLPLMAALALHAMERPELFLPPPNVPPRADVPCLACNGSGKAPAKDRGVQTATTGRTRFVAQCRACKGEGHLVRDLLPEERLQRQRTQRQRFDREQLAAGHEPVAGGYVARGMAEGLLPDEFAQLAKTCPRPCKTCVGLGIAPCRKCKGTGKITERTRDDDGEVAETEVTCPTCRGAASQPCRRCQGEGLLPICKKCGGMGTALGKSRDNEPVPVERCRSCKGEGRR